MESCDVVVQKVVESCDVVKDWVLEVMDVMWQMGGVVQEQVGKVVEDVWKVFFGGGVIWGGYRYVDVLGKGLGFVMVIGGVIFVFEGFQGFNFEMYVLMVQGCVFF